MAEKKRKWKRSSEELKERFARVLGEFEGVEMRKMFGCPCSFVNGNMFTGLHEENWIIRLSEEDRDEAKELMQAKPFEPMKGRAMREYIALPPRITKDASTMQDWLQRSLNFASSLPPKKK